MGLKTLIRELAGERGVEIDDAELDSLGLADDSETPPAPEPDDVLSEELPGDAAGRLEIFLAAGSTTVKDPSSEEGELLWYPIIREGQWAVRPGQTGKKKRAPLKVIAGKSANQRREIGLQDIVDAFDEQAIQHVTVPMSHGNTLAENTGFIDKLKIVKGEVKNQATKKMDKVAVLMGAYRFTEPDVKGKVMRGTFANRSAGLLYDYVDTERGLTWPVVLEHCALTNKPWITGMANFGRKLAGATKLDTVALSLSDEGPADDEYALILTEELELSAEDGDFLAQESSDWSKEGSPNWLAQQVNSILSAKRSEKEALRRATMPNAIAYDYDYPARYRCREAKPGKALIADGYDDDANYWAAPITVKDGAVDLAEFSKWTALKKAFIPDTRPDPPANQLPLEQTETPPKTRLELAQEARKVRFSGSEKSTNPPREVVKQDMSDQSTQLSDLSPEARRMIEEANARAEAAEASRDQFAQKLDRITGTVQGNEVDKYIDHLKTDLGLSEDKGFGGMLIEVRQLMLADDGEPTVAGEHFATDSNKTGEITLSEGVKRIFGALEKAQEGKEKIGDQLSQPSDAPAEELDENGKQIVEENPDDGKPAPDDKTGDSLSTEDKVNKIAETNPELARVMGRPLPAATAATNGGKS